MPLTLLDTAAGTVAADDVAWAAAVFWDELAAARLYRTWRTQNPGEYLRLDAYCRGGPPAPMLTPFGRALVAHVLGERLVGVAAHPAP